MRSRILDAVVIYGVAFLAMVGAVTSMYLVVTPLSAPTPVSAQNNNSISSYLETVQRETPNADVFIETVPVDDSNTVKLRGPLSKVQDGYACIRLDNSGSIYGEIHQEMCVPIDKIVAVTVYDS